tara:strand:+ start:68258 stop:68539 length:282 start_codon:yes stop_codon:yes gene_type:complete
MKIVKEEVVKEVLKFIAKDGTVFNRPSNCINYELKKELESLYTRSRLHSDINWDINNLQGNIVDFLIQYRKHIDNAFENERLNEAEIKKSIWS